MTKIKHPNRLSQPQFVEICLWLKENESKRVIQKASLAEIAGRAGAKLGFNVLPLHIKRAAETLNIKWLLEDMRSRTSAENSRSKNAITPRDVAILASHLVQLYDKWEDHTPEEIIRIDKKYRKFR